MDRAVGLSVKALLARVDRDGENALFPYDEFVAFKNLLGRQALG